MYLSGAEIEDWLDSRFGITATVGDGDAAISSAELDAASPFIGERQDSEQEHAFPRSVTPMGETNDETDPPDAVLDWVALNAYRVSSADAPAIVSRSRSGLSETYASPMPSQAERRMAGLLAPYLRYSGRSSNSTYYPRSFESYPNA